MTRGECEVLAVAVEGLKAADVPFALVHEGALVGWGIDNNVFLECVDALVIHDGDFEKLGCKAPNAIGTYAKVEHDGVSMRLWSRRSLGLSGPVEVTACPRYECEALAPELVLAKLPYSPNAPMLMEQRARLAATLMVDELTDDELMLVARYVRGD